MKTLLMAASALSLLAAPAFAQSVGSSSIAVGGNVDAQCGAGAQSGGGFASTPTIALGEMTDANGQLSVAEQELNFGNMWCNGAASLRVTVSALSTDTVVGDTASFVNTLDMVVTDGTDRLLLGTYMGGGEARTGTDKVAPIGGAFETGNGKYAKASLNVVLPAGTVGNDRPVAGIYSGTIVFTATAS